MDYKEHVQQIKNQYMNLCFWDFHTCDFYFNTCDFNLCGTSGRTYNQYCQGDSGIKIWNATIKITDELWQVSHN